MTQHGWTWRTQREENKEERAVNLDLVERVCKFLQGIIMHALLLLYIHIITYII